MRKFTFLVIAMMLSLGAAMAQTVFDNGYFTYETLNATDVMVKWPNATFPGGACDIPATVTNEGVTYNVTKVRQYFISKFDNAKLPTSLTVPEGVTSFTVGEFGTFDVVTNIDGGGDIIVSLSLPSTIAITLFTDYTFRGHSILKDFTIKMATPPDVEPSVFFNCNNDDTIRIHIPAGTKAAYEAKGWTTDNLGGYSVKPEYGTREIILVEDVTTALHNVSASTINVRAISRNSFMVTGLKGKADVNIYELSGKRVAGFTQISNNDVLTDSSLKAGLLIVKVNNGANSTTAKLVLN